MHKVEHSLRVGAAAVAEISADAPLDETVPSGGTVMENIAKGLSDVDRLRKAFIARRMSPASVPARRVPQAVKSRSAP